MISYIYSLRDPLSLEVRYIGMTINPDKRLYDHTSAPSNDHRGHWLKTLKRVGVRPIMELLEAVPTSDVDEAERWWIAKYKESGAKLTNIQAGGRAVSTAARERKGASLRGRKRSPEACASISAGLRASLAFRAKNSLHITALNKKRAGKPLSLEHRRRVSEALKGKPKPEKIRTLARLRMQQRWADPATREKMLADGKATRFVTKT